MSQPQAGKARTSTGGQTQASSSGAFWEFADLGFDTGKKLWFIQFYDETNKSVGSYFAKNVTISRGSAFQYEWKDNQGRPFWHVRERFFASEVQGFTITPSGSVNVEFKPGSETDVGAVPEDFAYLTYAYHLSNKEAGQRAPMGFVEFFNANGDLLRRINNRWIIIEDVGRKTTGDYPKIRLRIDRKDIENVIATRTTIIIQGNPR